MIARNGAATTTSVLRLAGACLGGAGSPRADFASLVWAGDADTADSDIAAFPLQGYWTFELYTNASDSTPAATTRRRTLQRAPTLAELGVAAGAWSPIKLTAFGRSVDSVQTFNDSASPVALRARPTPTAAQRHRAPMRQTPAWAPCSSAVATTAAC